LFLFGSKAELIQALLGRAREDELELLSKLQSGSEAGNLVSVASKLWSWLAADEHRALLTLWVEGYARSLVDPDGPWGAFAQTTVNDWLDVLACAQPPRARGGA